MEIVETNTLVEEKKKTEDIKQKSIIIYNDDVNTFEWVIICLMQKCKHSIEQAEQCANIIHNNGKCGVKTGSYETLKPINQSLIDAGLSSKIE